MSTFSEEILKRYSAVEHEADSFGRIITVGRLRPAERQAVMRLADSDRGLVLGTAMVAGSVREIDDGGSKVVYRPPVTEADLAIILNALEDEGFAAANTAFNRLNKNAERPGEQNKSVEEAAKN